MRRFLVLLCTLLIVSGFIAMPASAESAASKVDLYCTVNAQGDCLVTMEVLLRLEQNHDSMYFPLPANAKGITLNGSNVTATKGKSSTLVNISRITQGYQGNATMRFEYTIPNAVKVKPREEGEAIGSEKQILLTLPLLCGFELPVEKLSFTVTMPVGEMPYRPVFKSIYRQDSIESDLTILRTSSQIIGSSNVVMNDREGITMTMQVSKEMFPTVSTYIREGNPELVPILVFAGLALLYWLLTLRTWPIRRLPTTTAPEGITAGEMGCRLTLSGSDLTMMVFSWAQLGYILINQEESGRIILHKRMDMGNERDRFENKVFNMLFGNRRVVDATGVGYAKLVRKVLTMVPEERNMYRGNSGNMKIFRGLACISQIFCGICVALNMSGILWLGIIMAVILGIFGAVSGWLIQRVAYRHHLRGKQPVFIGLGLILVWILLGVLSGQPWIPLGCALGQWAIGYLAAYGGRRSDLGLHDAGQVLGLRHYVKHLPQKDINRLLMNDPDFFFLLAPYALALGVINPYARAFGERKMGQCPYLFAQVTGKRTALEWAHLMTDTADMMDYKAHRMEIDKWFAVPAVQVNINVNAPKKKKRPRK